MNVNCFPSLMMVHLLGIMIIMFAGGSSASSMTLLKTGGAASSAGTTDKEKKVRDDWHTRSRNSNRCGCWRHVVLFLWTRFCGYWLLLLLLLRTCCWQEVAGTTIPVRLPTLKALTSSTTSSSCRCSLCLCLLASNRSWLFPVLLFLLPGLVWYTMAAGVASTTTTTTAGGCLVACLELLAGALTSQQTITVNGYDMCMTPIVVLGYYCTHDVYCFLLPGILLWLSSVSR